MEKVKTIYENLFRKYATLNGKPNLQPKEFNSVWEYQRQLNILFWLVKFSDNYTICQMFLVGGWFITHIDVTGDEIVLVLETNPKQQENTITIYKSVDDGSLTFGGLNFHIDFKLTKEAAEKEAERQKAYTEEMERQKLVYGEISVYNWKK